MEIIQSYQDHRIRVFNYTNNQGYLVHLNEGLHLAQGKYIARMDSDDICMPERFEKQVIFLETHHQIAICGSWVEVIGAQEKKVFRYPTDNQTIQDYLMFHSTLNHPSVMMRYSILKKYGLQYQKEFYTAEDYKLWSEIAKYAQLANLPEILLQYRIHNHKVSFTKDKQQKEAIWRIQKENIEFALERTLTESEINIYQKVLNHYYPKNKNQILEVKNWIKQVKKVRKNHARLPIVYERLTNYWFDLCKHNKNLARWIWYQFIKAGIYHSVTSHIWRITKLSIYLIKNQGNN